MLMDYRTGWMKAEDTPARRPEDLPDRRNEPIALSGSTGLCFAAERRVWRLILRLGQE